MGRVATCTTGRPDVATREDQDAPSEYVSMTQAGELLAVHPTTVRYWIRRGYLRGYKVGPKTIRILRADLLGMVEQMSTGTRTGT